MTDGKGIVFMNERWTELTGQPIAQALGHGWVARVHPDDDERLRPYRERCRQTGEPYEGEIRYRRKDGQYRWHAFRALPSRGAGGAIEQWFGVSVDVHDARQAQEALKEADRRKDEFLATLAHELRNPLAPIRNALQLLKRSPATEASARAAAQDVMERQVSHMVRLIDDLLDVSPHHARQARAAPRAGRALGGGRTRARDARGRTSRQQLTIKLPSEPIRLDADPVRLSQVMSNLLNNAAKFTPKSGHISVTADAGGICRGDLACATTAPAFRPTSCRTFSGSSRRSARRSSAPKAAWASACRSPARWSSCTAAASRRTAKGWARAASSSCGSPFSPCRTHPRSTILPPPAAL